MEIRRGDGADPEVIPLESLGCSWRRAGGCWRAAGGCGGGAGEAGGDALRVPCSVSDGAYSAGGRGGNTFASRLSQRTLILWGGCERSVGLT